ncbi:MAG TPA: DNA-binding domain-containing protein [Gammaproteobacteria bacterium]|nr:DNA-binding domain-containing protein [Gammaproteobacteria bacterium]
MLTLPELQQKFAEAVRGGTAAGLPLRDHGIPGVRRLQVYRNNHVSALREALRAVYPVTQRLVGEEFFAAAADAYGAANPSHGGNIQDYGGAFPRFLEDYAPAASLPYLGDVAALEWRRLQTAFAAPHAPMDVRALAEVPADALADLRFHHQPAARAFDSQFPILSIWRFCQQTDPEGRLELDKGSERVLFSRKAVDVEMRLLSPGEYAFLRVLCRGETFAEACRTAFTVERSFDVEERFAALVRDEILTGFYL